MIIWLKQNLSHFMQRIQIDFLYGEFVCLIIYIERVSHYMPIIRNITGDGQLVLFFKGKMACACLLYTSDAADE